MDRLKNTWMIDSLKKQGLSDIQIQVVFDSIQKACLATLQDFEKALQSFVSSFEKVNNPEIQISETLNKLSEYSKQLRYSPKMEIKSTSWKKSQFERNFKHIKNGKKL